MKIFHFEGKLLKVQGVKKEGKQQMLDGKVNSLPSLLINKKDQEVNRKGNKQIIEPDHII